MVPSLVFQQGRESGANLVVQRAYSLEELKEKRGIEFFRLSASICKHPEIDCG